MSIHAVSLVQLSGRNSRKLSMSGTSPEASVNDTSVWQFAFLPSTEHIAGRPRPKPSPSWAGLCRR